MLAREGPRQSMRMVVCSRLGRPARTPPHARVTRDDQYIGLEKFRAKRKDKKINVFDKLDWMPQSVWLFIFIRCEGLTLHEIFLKI